MSEAGFDTAKDRRADVRLAGHGPVEAVVLDRYERPIEALRNVEVVNVSAGGMMLASSTPTGPGGQLMVTCGDYDQSRNEDLKVQLEVGACFPSDDHLFRICCRLKRGRMPARLIYNW